VFGNLWRHHILRRRIGRKRKGDAAPLVRRTPIILEDFRRRAALCRTREELRALIAEVARDAGFDFIAILHSTSLVRATARLIRYDTYPQGWGRRLVARGDVIVDPILAIARRRQTGFLWTDALVAAQLTSVQHNILDEASRNGIRQGYTVPANVPGEPEGSISFATRSTRPISRERQRIIDEIGRIAFEEKRRILGYGREDSPAMSPRERQVISWIARGKADVDIAVLIGCGLETVRTYVKSAMRKLGVITRAQMIEVALRMGIIDFSVGMAPYD
jgi:DNA-binding CsgD family transcriptional regulator